MRQIDPAIAAHRASRSANIAHVLIWIAARNRQTGAIETLGLWTGDDHYKFIIDGEARLYYGAGAVLECDPIEAATGLDVRNHEIRLSSASPEVLAAILGYNPRFAPVEIHRAEFDVNGALIAAPERNFRGWIDGSPFTWPEIGGEQDLRVQLVSEARGLTLFSGATKSDACQSRRGGCRFRRYGSVSDTVEVAWGEHRSGA